MNTDATKRTNGTADEGAAPARQSMKRHACTAESTERALLWANPEFQAALEAARVSLARDEGKPLEQIDRDRPLTPGQIAEADAWLDEYERRLAREACAEPGISQPEPARGDE